MFSIKDVETQFPDNEVIKEFPPSGQKQVFLIRNNCGKELVLKLVNNANERVLREIEIVTEFCINNVPSIFEVNTIQFQESEYLAVFEEYIEGLTLTERLRSGKLSLIEGINLIRSLLETCLELEKINVVHRDIKPSNLICKSKEEYYLIDFGIARQLDKPSLTMTNLAIGPHTPGYGAPELFQYNKKEIDSRSDLFSIGVVAYEALVGKHPFITGEELNVNEIWYRTRTLEPKYFEIEGDKSAQLIGFIQTLMQKHVTRRPPNVKKALEWFEALLPTIELGGE